MAMACDMLGKAVSDFSRPAQAWVFQKPIGEDPGTSDKDTVLKMIDDSDAGQAEVKAIALRIWDLAPKMESAVEAKDDALAQQIMNDAKKPHDEFIARCSKESDWGSKSSIVSLRGTLDSKPGDYSVPSAPASAPTSSAAPTSSKAPKPFTPTKLGTTVKLGEPVSLEFTYQGQKGQAEFTVTGVRTATSDDLKSISEEARAKAKTFVFVEATAKYPKDFDVTKMSSMASPTDLYPRYEVAATDGSTGSHLTVIGSFKPCEDDKSSGLEVKFCSAYGFAAPDAKVSEVRMIEANSEGPKSDGPLFIWKK
ncbi:hypothetical protein ACH46_03980 [Gordonia phthalatica]|uniref:Uncharacterized protein n=1 Tax=Gordonia phthalatica TaxID=1136941 RepID=A0A0N9N9D5_9ACTN|nr:hypothetical protein ACH46_03980 [Gordonia phthalatica]